MTHIAVIGGGPAGSSVSALLAKRGYDVELFEAEQFPRAHIGESLLPVTLEALDLTGAGPKVREAGFTVKGGATMAWGTNRELWTWYFKETNTKQPHSFQVNRDEFDHILLQHAIDSGVKVHQGHRVEQVNFDGDDIASLVVGDRQVSSDFFIDASGQKSILANQLKTKEWDPGFQNLAIFRYYQGGSHLEGEASGNILVESCEQGWFWKIPLKNQISSVGLVADREHARQRIGETSVQQYFEESLAQTDYAQAFLKGSQPINDCSATRDWSYQSNQFVGPNYCLIGDAACFIDPLFSTGVHLAIYSAILAASYIRTHFESPSVGQLAGEQFESSYRHQYEHFRELAQLFYSSNRSVDSYFWQARQLTGESEYEPREAFIRAVSGQVSHGYERSTLAHGTLPPSFKAAVEQQESERDQRSQWWEEVCTGKTPLKFADNVTPTQGVALGDLIFEESCVLKRPGVEDLPVSVFVAHSISQLTPTTTLKSVSDYLIFIGYSEEFVEANLNSAWRLLYLDGILEAA